jgi:hypothetical protein
VGLVSTAAANQATTSFDPFGQTTTAPTGSLLGYQGDLTSLGDDDDDLKALSHGYSNSQEEDGSFNPGAYEVSTTPEN